MRFSRFAALVLSLVTALSLALPAHTRVAHKVTADGKKVRVCKHCGAEL